MSNEVFPTFPGLVYPVVKTPTWRTDIAEAASGKETRVGFWSFPKWQWKLKVEVLRDKPALGKDELWDLFGFFNRHGGNFDSWLFNDPDDNSVTDQVFGVGTGSQTQFQLARTRGSFTEPVTGLPTVTQLKSGASIVSGSVDNRGLVTFASAPANGSLIRWTGTYYWRCRFLEEMMDLEKFAERLWESNDIEFVSVK